MLNSISEATQHKSQDEDEEEEDEEVSEDDDDEEGSGKDTPAESEGSDDKSQRNENLRPLTDDECLLAVPRVKGFDLQGKEWCKKLLECSLILSR